MKQLPSIKILAIAIALQFVLLVGVGVVQEKKDGHHITLSGLYSSVSQTKIATLLSNVDSKHQVGQAGGDILKLGDDSNDTGLVTCNRGYHIGDIASCGPCELLKTIQKVLTFLILVSVLIASIMFAYAGFLYLTSSTNPGNIAKAKGVFWNVLFGFVAVLGAWIVINTILNTLAGRPLTAVSQIACENERRGVGYLPNPSAGQSILPATDINRAREALSKTESEIERLEEALAICRELETPSDRSTCIRESQASLDAYKAERLKILENITSLTNKQNLEALKAESRALIAEGVRNQCDIAANSSKEVCVSIAIRRATLNGEIAALEREIATTPAGGTPNTTPTTSSTPGVVAAQNLGLQQSTVYPNSGCSHTGGACYVDPNYNTKLALFKGNLDTSGAEAIAMTSAYDTVNHVNACHSNGTCADFDFTNTSYNDSKYETAELQNMAKFIDSANKSGMKAEWEVSTQAQKDLILITAGDKGINIPSDNVRVVRTLDPTATHFSLYCNQARTNSC